MQRWLTYVARTVLQRGDAACVQEDPAMGDRVDETIGNTKKALGDMTGNEDLEREGQAQADGAKLHREVEGAVDQTVGKAQETWGDITDDKETELAGQARQAEGQAKRAG
jgi:uncharacterized protein YjbJ (UPF0337 family)